MLTQTLFLILGDDLSDIANVNNLNTINSAVETVVSKKMPASLSMPIIPLARTQLEDLVKNLDAELVLDCVSKKMFDNFSMWDLQLKKMQLNKEKGLKRLEVMLEDMENILVELKKMVDNCLTHTKLCDTPAPSVTLGEALFVTTRGEKKKLD